MEENRNHYIKAGQKNWLNLRKDVCIVENYCKEHFNGKIPPKHKVSDILHVALQRRDSDGHGWAGENIKRVRTRGNRARKNLLEDKGTSFPKPKDSHSSNDENLEMAAKPTCSVLRTALPNKAKETEQLTMVLKQSLLDSTSLPSTTTPSHHPIFQQSIAVRTPYVFNQAMGVPSYPYYSSNVSIMQYPNMNIQPAFPSFQQAPFCVYWEPVAAMSSAF